jgi:precorrin-6A/cobalt-precorrin-6A reductase
MGALKLLILGGSSEGITLARALAGDARFAPTLSFAGRTERPAPTPIPMRRGGFGGAEGLARYLRENGIDILVDATHPFAARMKEHAVEAAQSAGVPLLAIRRPSWEPKPGDHWLFVEDLDEAAIALGEKPRHVLLTTGRQELEPFVRAAQHSYVLRSVEAPSREELPPDTEVITARGPFTLQSEVELLRDKAIDVVVTKNSGGAATAAKLEAARILSLLVIVVRRPEVPASPESVATVTEALAWLDRAHGVISSA